MTATDPLAAFERTLTRAMLVGVWVSSLLLAAGLTIALVYGASRDGDMLLRSGLLTLMATPLLRVVLSVIEAIRRRDWFWVWTTAAVVLVLTGTVVYSLRTAA